MTRDEIVSAALDRLTIEAGDSVKVAQAQMYAQMEHQRAVIEMRLLKKFADVGVTAGSNTAGALPTDFAGVASLRAGDEQLEPVSDHRMFEMDASTVGATVNADSAPEVYNFVSADPPTLWIWPAPGTTSATGLRLVYYAKPTLLATNVAPPNLPVEWHDLLVEAVVHRLALSEEEPTLAAAAKANMDDLRSRMWRELTRRQGPTSSRGHLLVYGD